MRWERLGIVWRPQGEVSWARTHATLPTPFALNEEVIRVYVTCLDDAGRGRPIFVDVAAREPTRVLDVSQHALLEVGRHGAFDDNGVATTSVVKVDASTLFMYYAGFELCTKIRYRIFTGLAISRDAGRTFERASEVPVLDRSHEEQFFRCGAFAMREEGRFRLWYIAGSEWTRVNGKEMPVYDLHYQESKDGIRWSSAGHRSMSISGGDEHGFGRPWVVRRSDGLYQLYYSIRRRSVGAYRLGYAESHDGLNWERKDQEMGLDVIPGGFDSDAIMYSAVISMGGRTFCFYNGNNFGEQGFGVAELVE